MTKHETQHNLPSNNPVKAFDWDTTIPLYRGTSVKAMKAIPLPEAAPEESAPLTTPAAAQE